MTEMNPLTCRTARRLMYEDTAAERSAVGRTSLEAHTSVCRDCATEWRELQTVTDWMGNYPVPEPDDRYWQHLAATITARAVRERRRAAPGGRWLPWVPAVAAAAGCAVLLFVSGLLVGQRRPPRGETALPPPSLPKVPARIMSVSVPVPVVVVRTERVVETRVVTRWREKRVPVYLPLQQTARSDSLARADAAHQPTNSPTHQPTSASPAAPGDEPPPPQVERNEFREYVVRSLPEPPLVPAAGRTQHWGLDKVVDEPNAAPHPEPAGTFVAPVRVVEVRAWPAR
jgi:hypothetical protein